MTRLALAFLFATMLAGCGVHVRAGVPGPVPAPPPVVRAPAPPPAPARASRTHTLRAKDLEASFVRARVIYAQEVVAGSGRVGRIEYWGDDGHRGRGRGHAKGRGRGHARHGDGPDFRWGTRDVSMPEVHADVIYVKELRARHVEAQVIVARDVHIGR